MVLLRILCRRLRQTSEQVEDVMFRDLESRVAKALSRLAESVALPWLRSTSVELHVSQRELGSIAGGSRESVNKNSSELVSPKADRSRQGIDPDLRYRCFQTPDLSGYVAAVADEGLGWGKVG
jgi:CRP-like cAMP-binding protein